MLEPPPPPPQYYAWTIQNFINVLIFRVMPHACYVKGTMKRQKSIIVSSSDQLNRIQSSTDSDCTRTISEDLESKKFLGEGGGGGGGGKEKGGMPADPPRWSVCKCTLTHATLAAPPPPQ